MALVSVLCVLSPIACVLPCMTGACFYIIHAKGTRLQCCERVYDADVEGNGATSGVDFDLVK
jgi:hypothetical protein